MKHIKSQWIFGFVCFFVDLFGHCCQLRHVSSSVVHALLSVRCSPSLASKSSFIVIILGFSKRAFFKISLDLSFAAVRDLVFN